MINAGGVQTSDTGYYRADYDTDYMNAISGDNVLSGGIAALYGFMNLLSEQSNIKFDEMKRKSEITRESQSMANRVDSSIALAAKGGDKGVTNIEYDVYTYMYDNNISVNGKSIKMIVPRSDQLNATIRQVIEIIFYHFLFELGKSCDKQQLLENI